MIFQRAEKWRIAGPIQKSRYSHLCSLCCFTTKLYNSAPEGAGPDMRVKRILMRVITVVVTAGFSIANLHTNLITAGTVLSALHKLPTYPCHRSGKEIPYYFIYQWAHWGTYRLSVYGHTVIKDQKWTEYQGSGSRPLFPKRSMKEEMESRFSLNN